MTPIVIGTGISSLGCVLTLIGQKYRPIVVDASADTSTHSFRLARHLPRRARLTGTAPYRIPAIDSASRKGVSSQPNFTFGGFSTAWGGYLGDESTIPRILPFNHQLQELNLPRIDYSLTFLRTSTSCPAWATMGDLLLADAFRKNLSRADNESYKWKESLVALHQHQGDLSLSTMCERSNEHVWSTQETFALMHQRDLIDYRPHHYLSSINVVGETLDLNFRTRNGDVKLAADGPVFLATGPMSTAEILVRSRLAKFVRVHESAAAFGFIVVRSQEVDQGVSHSLTQLTIRANNDRWLAQLYSPLTEQLASRLLAQPGTALTRALHRLRYRVLPAIVYLPQVDSGSISVQMRDRGEVWNVESDASVEKLKQAIADLRFNLAPVGFLTSRFQFRRAGVGASFHLGASVFGNSSRFNDGTIQGVKGLYVVDGSSLNHVPLGSTLLPLLENAESITRFAVK